MIKILILSVVIFASGILHASNHRAVILTDLGPHNDPGKDGDDIQSLVRLLVYANVIDIEGLVATVGWSKQQSNTGIFDETIHDAVKAYEKVYANLKKHDAHYPKPEYLKSIIKKGRHSKQTFWKGDHMKEVGKGKSTEASKHIIDVLKKSDPRPVWFLGWGKMMDLAQAIWDINASDSKDERDRLFNKIRVYDIAGQDNAGAFITHTYPKIFYLCSLKAFQGVSTSGDMKMMKPAWIDANIRKGHGDLGAYYPSPATSHKVIEGDTPSFLWLIPNGISQPEDHTIGNWGGCFNAKKSKNKARFKNNTYNRFKDYYFYTEKGGKGEVSKWRTDFQNDFAARMDWCTKPYNKANHHPEIVVNGHKGHEYLHLKVKSKSQPSLDASQTIDPDGHSLSYSWVQSGPNQLGSINIISKGPKATIDLPKAKKGKLVHVLLTVTDDGMPPLKAWKRVVLTVQ